MVNNLKKKNNGKSGKSLFASLQKAYERFLKIRGNPHEIALGFALGLFVGVAPCMGIQTVIAVFLASLLKWNKISAAVGVWISNPISAPFLYGFTFYVGSLFTGITESFSPAGVFDFSYLYQIVLKAREIFWTLTLGGIIVGFPVAVLGYYLSYMAVNRYQNKIKRKIAEQKERLSARKERIKTRKKSKTGKKR